MKQKHHSGAHIGDTFYKYFSLGATIIFISLIMSLIGSLIWNSRTSIQRFGLSFLTNTIWNVPFLEIQQVRLKDNQFIVQFTVLIKPDIDVTKYVAINFEEQQIPLSYQLKQRSLMINVPEIKDGIYKITFNKLLPDQNNKILEDTLVLSITTANGKISSYTMQDEKGVLKKMGLKDENERHFGIFPFIIGTLLSSLLALCMTIPAAIAVSLLLTEFVPNNSKFAIIFSTLIDLLAGIPSVIYGLWGLFSLVPKLGANLLTASIILAIMTVPFAASLTREAISLVPKRLRDAGIALGASKFKIISHIILPYARSGIIAGILLTLGRSLGETLAVTMVIGNRNQIPTSLFSPTQTIASLIANEYGEATGLKQSALIEAGLILIIITLLFSLLGKMMIRMSNQQKTTEDK